MSVRYAPSPTGILHIGNFRTAVVAQLWARYLKAPFVIRYEDIDRDRSRSEYIARQREDFERLGLRPDAEEVQSQAHAIHFDYFERARQRGAIYPCFASRKQVAAGLENITSAPHAPAPIYDGTWRDRGDHPAQIPPGGLNWRLRAPEVDGSQDLIVARTQTLEPKAATFVPSYHWACALDDYRLAPRLLVRAWDLADVVEHQRRLQRLAAELDGQQSFLAPAVFHTSLVTDETGHRLEKRSRGVTLAELAVAGVTPAELRRRLEASFDLSQLRELAAGEVFGETKRELVLSAVMSS